jgi:tetratricopeptide (TPR) repeat protein
MGAGCARSLDCSRAEIFNPKNNNQVDKTSCINTRNRRRTLAWFFFLCLLQQTATSQTRNAENLPPPSPTVSVTELRGCGKAGVRLRTAHKEFSKGDLSKANLEIERALQIDPVCGPAFSMKAFIDLAARHLQPAIEDAGRAVAIDGNDAEAFVALAMAYNSLQEFLKAADAARHSLVLHPGSWQGRLELAKSFYGSGQFDLALHELDEIGTDFPDVHLVRGKVLLRLGRRQEALEEFHSFLQGDPQDPRSEQIRRIVLEQ